MSDEPQARLRLPIRSRLLRAVHSRPRAQSLVELALILPILLLLIGAALDLGRLYYSQITVTNAAREGALMAAKDPTSYSPGDPCADDNLVVCRAVNETSGSFVTVEPADVDMTCDPSCTVNAGNQVTVTVNGEFQLIALSLLPFLGDGSFDIAGSATAAIIQMPTSGTTSTPTPTPTATPTPEPTASPTPDPSATAGPTATPTASPSPTPVACVAAPVANFTVSPHPGIKNKPMTFTSTTPVLAGCVLTYSWAFGDGSVASPDATYVHEYDKRGTYQAVLTVTNQHGQSSQKTVTVTVNNN
jgi:Flp pilus assembly protein TadG